MPGRPSPTPQYQCAESGSSKLMVILTRRMPSRSPKKACVRSMSEPIAVMWCMPWLQRHVGRDRRHRLRPGLGGDARLVAVARPASRRGGARNSVPSASGASSIVQPGPRVAISRIVPSGSLK